MIEFAALLERLRFCPTDAHRRRVLTTASEQARALLSGRLKVRAVGVAVLRGLAAERVDPVLFALSRDFLGDFTETLALIWPGRPGNAPPPSLAEIIAAVAEAPRAELPRLLAGWLDDANPTTRVALLRLVSGKIRAVLEPPVAPAGTPGQITAMLIYAQSQRIGLERVYSFCVHGDDATLVPIARIAAGIPPAARAVLDGWVRDHSVAKFGPVREVAAGLVADIGFDAVTASPRHKSGIVLHGARLIRLRPELATADQLAAIRPPDAN